MAAPAAADSELAQLRVHLESVTRERDELAKDVEQLALSRGSHIFSSSYILAERMRFLETENKQQRAQLKALAGERDGLLEDIQLVRQSKRETDQGFHAARQRVEALERDLAFFQASSASAFQERDSAAYEAQRCQSQLGAAQAAVKESRAQLAAEQQHSQGLAAQLDASRHALDSAQAELALTRGQLQQLQQQSRDEQAALRQALDARAAAEQAMELLKAEAAHLQRRLADSAEQLLNQQQQQQQEQQQQEQGESGGLTQQLGPGGPPMEPSIERPAPAPVPVPQRAASLSVGARSISTPPPSPACGSLGTPRRAGAAALAVQNAGFGGMDTAMPPPSPAVAAAPIAVAPCGSSRLCNAGAANTSWGLAHASAAPGGLAAAATPAAAAGALHGAEGCANAASWPTTPGSDGRKELQQLLQLLWQRMRALEQLLLLAHHIRSALQGVQPGDMTAVNPPSGRPSAAAGKDAVARLSALAHELDAGRQLLGTDASAQQQHDSLVSSLEREAGVAAIVTALLRNAKPGATSGCSPGGASPVHGSSPPQQPASVLGGLAKLLSAAGGGGGARGAVGVPAPRPPAASAPAASAPPVSPVTPTLGGEPAGSAASSGSAHSCQELIRGRFGAVDAGEAVWAAQLDVALARELHLLAGEAVAALKHVQQLAALQALLADSW